MGDLYGLDVDPSEYIPFLGTGEAKFLGGVAAARGVTDVDMQVLKAAFFAAYAAACAAPGVDIGAPGARALVAACRAAGLKTALASSADRVKAREGGATPGPGGGSGVGRGWDAAVQRQYGRHTPTAPLRPAPAGGDQHEGRRL